MFRPFSLTYEKKGDMSLPRKTHGALAYDGNVYIVGGFHDTGPVLDVDCFGIESSETHPLPELPVPLSCVSLAELADLIYIIGYQSEGLITYSLKT
jgi:hypothetical protein